MHLAARQITEERMCTVSMGATESQICERALGGISHTIHPCAGIATGLRATLHNI